MDTVVNCTLRNVKVIYKWKDSNRKHSIPDNGTYPWLTAGGDEGIYLIKGNVSWISQVIRKKKFLENCIVCALIFISG